MAEMSMPSRHRKLDSTEVMFKEILTGWVARKRVQASSTSVMNKCSLRVPIFDKKKRWMKLKENIIIRGGTMNGG
jgi:hypothetical protein